MNEMKEILLPGEPPEVDATLSRPQLMLFAPIDKRAFGIAIGTVSALGVALLTVLELVLDPHPSVDLSLLAQYFPGYSVSLTGLIVGSLWAFAVGFCGGWLTAFTRNFVLAVSLFLLRSKAELADSRDFLDHI